METAHVLILVIFIALVAYGFWPRKQKFCPSCGHIGIAATGTKGHLLIEILLWCLFIVPGLIYTLWRLTTKGEVCESCGSAGLIPPDSPVARKIQREL